MRPKISIIIPFLNEAENISFLTSSLDAYFSAKKEFDVKELVARVQATKAIGFFTKLSLKNQIDDLLGKFRCYHGKTCDTSLATLNEEFNLLLMKVLSLLQDDDPDLFRALAGGREFLWKNLTDPIAFAKLDGRAS